MSSAPVHPVSLRFASPLVEAAFRADYARRAVVLVRGSVLLGLLQYAGFGVLDRWMVPVATAEVRLIRVVVCLYMAAAIAYTFAPSFLRRMQGVVASVPLVCGLGIAAMTWVAQSDNAYYHYYVGVVLVLVYVHVLLRLRFLTASAVGAVLVAAYLGVLVATRTPGPMIANNAFFLLSASFSGMVASYALERYARQVFHHTRRQARTNAELAAALDGLRAAQARLIQQEKMAGLGRLTAGVAHEIKNPLNFVNNFAGLSEELAEELRAALDAALAGTADPAEAAALLADLRQNVAKIREHGQRADAIVRGMLAHAGPARGAARAVDLNDLVGRQAALARDAFRHRHAGFDPAFCFDPDPELAAVAVVPQEIGRVVTALVDNALHAVLERVRTASAGDGAAFTPAVTVRTRRAPGGVRVEVADNGTGIPAALQGRVFEPFFTTKPTGQGTGLDLSMAYEVVTNGHGGTLAFESAEGRGTTFTVTLPAAGAVVAAATTPAEVPAAA